MEHKLLFLHLLSCCLFISTKASLEGNLTKHLLKNYVKSSRPVINEKDAVDVSFGMTLQGIEDVNIKENSITTTLWLNFGWTDQFMIWNNMIKYAEIDDIRLTPSEVWTPDIEAYNGNKEPTFLANKNTIVVSNSGQMTLIPPYKYTTSCKIDTTWYPFDEQRCDLKFGSWTYNGYKLNIQLQADEIDTSTFVLNDDWALLGAPCVRNEVVYECCPEPYIDVTCSLKLRRRSKGIWGQVIIPQNIFAFIFLLSSFIPVSEPTARTTVKLLMFLLVCVYTPKTLPSSSLLATMLGTNTFIMMLGLLHDVLLIILHSLANKEKGGSKKSPQRVVWLVDISVAGTLMVAFILAMLLNILSAPFLIVN